MSRWRVYAMRKATSVARQFAFSRSHPWLTISDGAIWHFLRHEKVHSGGTRTVMCASSGAPFEGLRKSKLNWWNGSFAGDLWNLRNEVSWQQMEANWPEEFTTKEFRHAKHTKSRIENHVAGRFYNGKDAKQVCRNAGYLGEWMAISFGCSPKNRLELSRIAVALRKRTASIISDASLNRIIGEMLVLKLICMSSLLYERFIGSASVKSERFTNVTSTWHDAPDDKLGSRVMRALFVGKSERHATAIQNPLMVEDFRLL